MKHVSAVTELVIMTAMMVTFIPLFMVLIHEMNMSKYTFLEDKTKIEATAVNYVDVEATIVTESGATQVITYPVPDVMVPMSYTVGDAVMSMVIFDEYAPYNNVICMEGDTVNVLDMTDYKNFINRDDYINSWYNRIIDISNCKSDYIPDAVKEPHNPNTKMYLNYLPKTYVNGERRPVWSFDHIFIDRIGVDN